MGDHFRRVPGGHLFPMESPEAAADAVHEMVDPCFIIEWIYMRCASIRALSGLLLACVSMQSAAGVLGYLADEFGEAYKEGKTTHLVDIDNDSLLLNKDDGFYTSGLRYTQATGLAIRQVQPFSAGASARSFTPRRTSSCRLHW